MAAQKRSVRPTINDVARIAGVSGMSVSLAFKNSPKLSEATRQRILEAAEKLNYVPNQAARQLRSGKTDIIGFLVTDLSNPFHSTMMKHAEHAFNEMGKTLFFAGSDWQADREKAFIEKLIRMQACGVLICSCEKNEEAFELLERAKVPYVALDTVSASYSGPCVINDLAMCGSLMAKHFQKIGARKPAYIDASPEKLYFSAFESTRTSFMNTLQQHSLCVKEQNYVPAGMTLDAGAKAFHQLKETGFDTDAVFCVNDLCALGFLNEAGKYGLKAGRDFALAGIDDLEISSLEAVSLTSIHQPYERIARESVRMLTGLMEGRNPAKRRLLLEQSLCERNTTLHLKK